MGCAVAGQDAVRVREYVSLREAAERAGLSRWTLYHIIHDRRLNHERGLRRLGSRVMIVWAEFKRAIDSGEFSCR